MKCFFTLLAVTLAMSSHASTSCDLQFYKDGAVIDHGTLERIETSTIQLLDVNTLNGYKVYTFLAYEFNTSPSKGLEIFNFRLVKESGALAGKLQEIHNTTDYIVLQNEQRASEVKRITMPDDHSFDYLEISCSK